MLGVTLGNEYQRNGMEQLATATIPKQDSNKHLDLQITLASTD